MPTAAKLVAAVIFAGMAFLVAHDFVTQMPHGSAPKGLRELAAVIAGFLGWATLGAEARRPRFADAAGAGLRTSLFAVFWSLLALAIYLMIKQSMSGKYDGPVNAVLSVFDIMYAQGLLLLQPKVLGILGAGGMLGGLVTEWVARRWP